MILRFGLPLEIRVFAPTADLLNRLETQFEHKDLKCFVRLVGGDVVTIDNADLDEEMSEFVTKIAPDRRCHRDITQLQCDIHDNGKLQKDVEERDFKKLSKLLRTIANRCLRAIRNFGIVGEIQEIPVPEEDEKPESRVQAWMVKTSLDGEAWTPLTTEPGLLEALLAFHLQKKAEMKAAAWKNIAEAIQDDRQANPEMEITVNALAHLDQKNYRIALLESIIALEIAFARFLREDLSERRGAHEAKHRSLPYAKPDTKHSTRRLTRLGFAKRRVEKNRYRKGPGCYQVAKQVGSRQRKTTDNPSQPAPRSRC